jgi:hypothetical protein
MGQTQPDTADGAMKKPSKADLAISAEALRTKARIWSQHGGRTAAQPFIVVAEYLEHLAGAEPAAKGSDNAER